MNLFIDEIRPGNVEDKKISFKVEMNSLEGETTGHTSSANVLLYLGSDEVNGLSLQQIHELAIDRAFHILKSFLAGRSSANLKSGF